MWRCYIYTVRLNTAETLRDAFYYVLYCLYAISSFTALLVSRFLYCVLSFFLVYNTILILCILSFITILLLPFSVCAVCLWRINVFITSYGIDRTTNCKVEDLSEFTRPHKTPQYTCTVVFRVTIYYRRVFFEGVPL